MVEIKEKAEIKEKLGIETKNEMIRYTVEDIAEKLKNQYNGNLVVKTQMNWFSHKTFPIQRNMVYIVEENIIGSQIFGIFPVAKIQRNFILGIEPLGEWKGESFHEYKKDDNEIVLYLLDKKLYNKHAELFKKNISDLAEKCGIKEVFIQKGP